MNIGKRIKDKRLEKKLTLEQVAEKIGTTRQTIHRYETGEITNIPSDKIEKISKALNTTPAYLMGWDEEGYEELLRDTEKIFNKIQLEEFIKFAQQNDYLEDYFKSLAIQLAITHSFNNGAIGKEELLSYRDRYVGDVMALTDFEANNEFNMILKETMIEIPVYQPVSCGIGSFVDDEVMDYVVVPTRWLNAKNQYFGQIAKGDSMKDEKIFEGDILIFEKTNVVENGKIGCFCIDENMAVCKKYMRDENSNIYLLSANENYSPIMVDVSNECFRVIGKLAFVVSDRR